MSLVRARSAAVQKPLVDPKQHAERVKQANQAPPPPVDGWTSDQQKQLEKALRDFPASMEKNERWSKMPVTRCSGRVKRDCVACPLKAARGALKKW